MPATRNNSIMLRKITAYLLFIFSLLFAATFFLLQGVTIKSLTFPGVKVTQLYIKLDKKLILDVEEIIISKQSNVEHSFDDIKKDIEKLPIYLKYFQQVHIEKLEISGNEFIIEINDDILFIDNKFINIAARPTFGPKKVTLDLYSLYLKDFGTLLEGELYVDYLNDFSKFTGTYTRKNVHGDLTLRGDDEYLDFNVNSNEMKNIHFVKELVRLHPIIEEWMYDNVLGTYHLKNFSGRVSTRNFQPLLKSFKGEATVTGAKVRFHKDVDYVHTPKITVKFGNDNLSFDILKPMYKDIDIDGSNVVIHNISGIGSNIDVNLFAKNRLSQDVLDIIKAYEVDLPIVQLDGQTDAKLTINVDFTTEKVSLDGEFKTKKANFKLDELVFLATDTLVILEDTNVYIKDAQINYDDMLDAKLNLNIDASKLNAVGDVTIKSFNIKANEQGILDVRDEKSSITVDFADNIEINLKELYSFIEINEKSFDVKVIELDTFYEQSELLKELNVTEGTLFLSINDFKDLDIYFKADVYDMDLPLKKEGKYLMDLTLEGTIKDDVVDVKTTDDTISIHYTDEVIKLFIKDTDIIVDTQSDAVDGFKQNLILQVENSNIDIIDAYAFDAKTFNISKSKKGVYFDGKLINLDFPLEKAGKRIDKLAIQGEYVDDNLSVKTFDKNLQLKILNKENILIDINGYDVIIDIDDSENFVDKNLKITGINSNAFINKKYKLLSNKYTFEVKNNKTQFSSFYKDSSVRLVKSPDGYRIGNGNNLSDEFVNKLLNSDLISGGKVNLVASGKGDVINGQIKFKDNKVKNLAFINNLILILNTTPALLNPLFAIPAAVDIAANEGFSVDGYEINEGEVDFSYNFETKVFNAKKLTTKGSIVDFSGRAVLDFENSTVDSRVDVAFMKSYANIVKHIPVINYIFLGEDKKVTTSVDITGSLDDPKYETNLGSESIEVPLDMLKRIFKLPGIAVDSVTGEEEKKEEPKK